MIGLVASRLLALRDTAGNVAWGPLTYGARSVCLAVLNQIRKGRLEIIDVDGHVYVCGEKKGSIPSTVITVHKDTFWVRLALFADMVILSHLSTDPELTFLQGVCRELHAERSVLQCTRSLLPDLHPQR